MELWLDPTRKQDFAFVSHAHADHTARHRKILSTPATSRLLRYRLGIDSHITLSPGEAHETGGGRLSLYPSGHILGAAQILVELNGERLLFTGDFKLKPSRTAEPCEIVPCDHLIMECTYGRSQYRFPDRNSVEERLIEHVDGLMRNGNVPVLFAYALGRAQEMTRLLSGSGYRVALEKKAFETAEIYKELGIDLGSFESFDENDYEGRVLIFPPHLWRSPVLINIRKRKTIAVTGWAMDGRQQAWYRSDAAFPLSDHADFDDLIQYVETARPRNVYLVHGFPDFIDHLKYLGCHVEQLA